MKKDKKGSWAAATALVFIGAFSRLLDFIPNFSPMEAIALFGGVYLASKAAAYLVPLVAMYVSDFALNNTVMRPFFPDNEGLVFFDTYMIYNAVGMMAIVAIAKVLLNRVEPMRLVGTSLTASAVFFVVTNVGSWISLPIYSKDIAGLCTAILAGIPFFNVSWISSLLFTVILFGTYEWYLRSSSFKGLAYDKV